LFPGIFSKPSVVQFDQRRGSSDGGAILLKAAERRYGLIGGLAGCLEDKRQAGKIDHSLRELLAQRVFSIACGYPDANDSARLGADPIHKMLLDRDPVTGLDLASQPTLSRFENSVGPRQLYRMGEVLAASVIERHAQRLRNRARLVTIDLDPTDDPTHGAQQLSFFNGHYDTWCYLPVMGFVSFNDEAEQYLCAAVLRPGNASAPAGAVGILRRLLNSSRAYASAFASTEALRIPHCSTFWMPSPSWNMSWPWPKMRCWSAKRKRPCSMPAHCRELLARLNMSTTKSTTRPEVGSGSAASSSRPR
jgi:hypothetical protein